MTTTTGNETPPVENQIAAETDAALDANLGLDAAAEIAGLQAEVAAANDRALRAHAELENFRKRSNRLIDDERKYAAAALARDLLSVIDNLERAIQTADKNGGGAAGLLEGVKMVATQFATVLEQHQIRRIAAKGEPFDPNLHQAIAQMPSEFAAGMVAEVAQAGYRLHDRVLRPAAVMVSTGPAAPPPAPPPAA